MGYEQSYGVPFLMRVVNDDYPLWSATFKSKAERFAGLTRLPRTIDGPRGRNHRCKDAKSGRSGRVEFQSELFPHDRSIAQQSRRVFKQRSDLKLQTLASRIHS